MTTTASPKKGFYLDEFQFRLTLPSARPGFVLFEDIEMYAENLMAGLPIVSPHEYDNANMPSASAVASGTIVYNSTYDVQMRSNGTRWVPMGPFTVDQNTRSDAVTGTIAESLMHSVDVSDAVRYMGSKGRLRITACWSCTSNANAKNCRIRIGTTAGTSGTAIFDSTVAGTSGTVADKILYARGSETAQGVSASSSPAGGTAGGSVSISTLNFAPGGSNVFVSLLAAPVGSGDTVTLNWYSIVVEPGF